MRTTLWKKKSIYLFAFFADSVSLLIPSFFYFFNPRCVIGNLNCSEQTTVQTQTVTTNDSANTNSHHKRETDMKILDLFLCFIIIAAICSCNHKNNTEFYLPAEWENQTGVIISGLDDAAAFEMVTQLSKESKVYTLVADSLKPVFIKKLSNAGANIDNIIFMNSQRDFSYAQRDGIMFMKNMLGEMRVINFSWNSASYKLFMEFLWLVFSG